MIKNEKQYKITKSKAREFLLSMTHLRNRIDDKYDPLLELEHDALKGQLADLQRELREYEELKSRKAPVLEFASIEDLSNTLIRSRIVLGLTQKDLAARTGLHEQQIQRYEQTDYESASLARIKEIFHALQLEKKQTTMQKSN